MRELSSVKAALKRRDDDLQDLESRLQDQEAAACELSLAAHLGFLLLKLQRSCQQGQRSFLSSLIYQLGRGVHSTAQVAVYTSVVTHLLHHSSNGWNAAAGEKVELQSVLNAALSRLEAAIGAAQSQEAKVASLVKQVRACATLSTHIIVCMMSATKSFAVPQLIT